MTDPHRRPRLFSAARAWTAEGARVALVTCLRCGSALLLDPADPAEEAATELHVAWHERLERTLP